MRILHGVAAATLLAVASSGAPGSREEVDVGVREVESSRLELRRSQGLVFSNGLPFSGVSIRRNASGLLVERVEYASGKRDGQHEMWFDDGTRAFASAYVMGKRHGETRTWWRNGNARTLSNYVDGRPEGLQTQWYAGGVMFKQMRLRRGVEHGLQQSWRENGKLYNNYEVYDGRIYGLKRSKLCFRLDDEELQISR